MSVFGKSEGHFAAEIEIYPCGPHTRTHPARNGIRWSFVYKTDVDELGSKAAHSDVWPDFIDENQISLDSETELIGTLRANMHIVFSNMIEKHLSRLAVGTEFYCMEGGRRVANGRVIAMHSLLPINGALASTSGYASEVDALFIRYEARDAAAVHAPWVSFFPKTPSRIIDIGAGTGRDAAWLTSLGHSVVAVEPVDELRTRAATLHPEPEITWMADILPDLNAVRARGETFDMVLMHAVWMHLTEAERIAGMAYVSRIMERGARLFMSLRHGKVPQGRRMFDVTGEETNALAAKHGLTPLFHERAPSIKAENHTAGIEWTKLVYEKA